MKITTLSRYGLRAAIELAKHYDKNEYITIRDISKTQNISLRYLENIMISLVRNGIVLSKKGRFGGFKLAKSPYEITVADIISSLETETDIVNCVKDFYVCEREDICASKIVWKEANDAMWRVFSKYTIGELADKEEKERVT